MSNRVVVALNILRGRSPATPALAASNLFSHDAPSAQQVVDIFAGEWSSQIPDLKVTPGHAALFDDPRIYWMNEVFDLNEKTVLELGPLEAAHTVMMERLGAKSILAIEGNRRAFLKCLCIKEIFNLKKSRFLLGDFTKFLSQHYQKHFDVTVASGVLYHMTDPLNLLKQLTAFSDRVFLWTHYFESSIINMRPDRDLFDAPNIIGFGGHSYQVAKKNYSRASLEWAGFSGGNSTYTVWLTKSSILEFFKNSGFSTQIKFDDPNHVNGPAFCLCATSLKVS